MGKGSRIRAKRNQVIASNIDPSDDDCNWFEDHPGVNERIRPPYPEELAMPNAGLPVTHMKIIQVKPGIRIRQPLFFSVS